MSDNTLHKKIQNHERHAPRKKRAAPRTALVLFRLVRLTYVISITLNGFFSIFEISNNLYIVSSVLFDL